MKSIKFERCKNIRDRNCLRMLAFQLNQCEPHLQKIRLYRPILSMSLPTNLVLPTASFQMTLTKCLTSYLIVWEFFRNVWIMQDLTDKKLWPCSAHSALLCSCKSAINGHLYLFSPLGRKILCECSQLVKIQKKQSFFSQKIQDVAIYIQPKSSQAIFISDTGG